MSWEYSTDDGDQMQSGRLGLPDRLVMKYGWLERLQQDKRFYYDRETCYWMQHAINPWAAIRMGKELGHE